MPRGYTRAQRAAKAEAQAANAANSAAQALESSGQPLPESPEPEPQERLQGTIQPRNEQRTRAFEELVASRGETPPAEEEDAQTPSATEPEAAQTPEAVRPTGATDATQLLGAPAAAPVSEAPTTKKQTVDGKEYDVPMTEIEEAGGERAWRVQRAQINRLDEMKADRAETKRLLDHAAAMARAAEAARTAVPEPTEDELIQAIRFGTPQEATAALKRMRGDPVDQNALVMKAAAINNYNAARRRFSTEFQDVTANPIIVKAALALENEWVQSFAQNGQVNWANLSNIDFEDGFRRIGNQVRSAFGTRPSQPASAPAANAVAVTTASPPSPPSAKEERKASIVNLPTAASARAEAPAEEKPETPREIINGMRKARGLHPI